MIIKLPLENYMNNTISIRGLSIDRKKKIFIFNSNIGKFKFGLIMRMLTKKVDIDGNIHCAYCGRILRYDEIVYSRIYPKCVGGVKIPDNMLVTCKRCDKNKGNMTKFEYLEYINSNKKEKLVLQEKVKKSIEFYRKERAYKIPKNWIEYVNIKDEELKTNLVKVNKNRLKLNKEFYDKYKYFITPIVINTQKYILDGIEKYKYAKEQKVKFIPVIIIENLKII